jgi:signal transduction histidine kinase
VVILHSYGQDFSPYSDVASSFEAELARLSPQPVEFFDASLASARFAEAVNEGPLVDYLHALLSERRPDFLVSVGGPAARFCMRQRERLFPTTPLLAAGVDQRWVVDISQAGNATAVTIALDLPAVMENILRLLPDTKEVVVVLGASPMSKLWLAEAQGDLERFSHEIHFTWTHDWSFAEIQKRVSALPPHSAILFGELTVDAAGVTHPRLTALTGLHAVANAPIFGLFDTQLDRGIVGGPLLSPSEAGERAAAAALRILEGAAPETLETPVTMSVLAYDFRELERWNIPLSRLPPGSRILFRPPSVWSEYRGPIFLGVGILALQTLLIGGLLLQRSRRRVAEEEVRELARRLLTAHEDERRRLARELHDDLSQRLARLSIDAAVMEESLGEPAGDGARAMREDLARLSDDVHALSYQLHPSVLDDLGLRRALQAECDRFSRREPIRADLASFDAPPELPAEVSACLFRIAQEALRNVARHSRASRVRLEVQSSNGGVQMTVKDDGVGFDPWRRARRSLGLASMRERASLVRGKLQLESAPGRGTTVMVSIPLRGPS